jgi:hypothetical protein
MKFIVKFLVTNTARGNNHLANVKDYLYEVYTRQQRRDHDMCTGKERELCARRKERTQIEGKKEKKGNILCWGGGKHSVKTQYIREKKREKSSLFYTKYWCEEQKEKKKKERDNGDAKT